MKKITKDWTWKEDDNMKRITKNVGQLFESREALEKWFSSEIKKRYTEVVAAFCKDGINSTRKVLIPKPHINPETVSLLEKISDK